MGSKNFSLEERISYLKQYGSHCMAYSTLQPGMDYFDIPGIGYLAYMKKGKTRFVLGDPICAEKDKEKLLEEALKEYKHTSFYQVSKSTAEILHKKFGFYMNIFGTETTIDSSQIKKVNKDSLNKYEEELKKLNETIDALTIEKDRLYEKINSDEAARKEFWKIKRELQKLKNKLSKNEAPVIDILEDFLSDSQRTHIRRQYRSALQNGLSVQENLKEDWDYSSIEKISSKWLSEMKTVNNEMKFFTRPLNFEFDKNNQVRLFSAKDSKGEMAGFLFLDPLYKQGKIFGYYADIIRVKPDAPSGTTTLLLLESMRTIFEEANESYMLGFSPFHKMGQVHFKKIEDQKISKRVDNKIMTFLFRNIFKYGNFLYNAKDQAFHKERYNGSVEHTYCCTRKMIPMKEIIDGFRVSGVDPLKQLKSSILRKR